MAEGSLILRDMPHGEPSAADELLPLVYDELRRLARDRIRRERPGLTLEATSLVHEAYVRLVEGDKSRNWNGRRHFFAAAAEAMRRILIESARRKESRKRGGGRVRQSLSDVGDLAVDGSDDLRGLDEALTKLASADAKAAELVRLRFFAGLSSAEAAEILDLSTRTAERLWAYARAWLHQEIFGTLPAGEKS